MTDPADTKPSDLLRAADIGRQSGLRYIYAGNLPGRVKDLENTCCHHCDALLVRRYSYLVQEYRITSTGTCPECSTPVPGRWAAGFDGQITATPFLPRNSSSVFTILNR